MIDSLSLPGCLWWWGGVSTRPLQKHSLREAVNYTPAPHPSHPNKPLAMPLASPLFYPTPNLDAESSGETHPVRFPPRLFISPKSLAMASRCKRSWKMAAIDNARLVSSGFDEWCLVCALCVWWVGERGWWHHRGCVVNSYFSGGGLQRPRTRRWFVPRSGSTGSAANPALSASLSVSRPSVCLAASKAFCAQGLAPACFSLVSLLLWQLTYWKRVVPLMTFLFVLRPL